LTSHDAPDEAHPSWPCHFLYCLGRRLREALRVHRSNAMHWFEMDAAGPEIARVLGPGGILAVGVIDNRVDSVAGLERFSGRAALARATRQQLAP